MKVFPETEYKNHSEMAENSTKKDSARESEKTSAQKSNHNWCRSNRLRICLYFFKDGNQSEPDST